jgi:2,5-diamino-6-(ribosylamino)-4(3H)-pyrimidinone 5'-phosphate reductase
MLPKVIIFNSLSLDGRIDGFNADLELYYELASKCEVEAILMDSDTVLIKFDAQVGELGENSDYKFLDIDDDSMPLLVVPDSGGKVRIWQEVLKIPYIRDLLVLCSRSTPQEYLNYLDERNINYMIIGFENVNLATALEELNTQFGVKSVRVDGGGRLNGVLINEDLVDEVCVLIHPTMVNDKTTTPIYTSTKSLSNELIIDLKLLNMKKLRNEVIFLHYRIMKYQF